MKEYSFKEIYEKYLIDEPLKSIVIEVLAGKPMVKAAKEYGYAYEKVAEAFNHYTRRAYTNLTDGPSADGKLTIEEIIKYLKNG